MAHSQNPRVFAPVLRFGGLSKILLQPLVLVVDLHRSIFGVVVVLGREGDYMHWADVETVKVVVQLAGGFVDHGESGIVLGEVAGFFIGLS